MSWQILQIHGNNGLLRYSQGHVEWCKYKAKMAGLHINNRPVDGNRTLTLQEQNAAQYGYSSPTTAMSNTIMTVLWHRPLVDVRAIVLSGFGNTVDCELLSAIGESDTILLQLSHSFKVATWTMRPFRIINPVVYKHQHEASSAKQTFLWELLLGAKYRFQEDIAGVGLGVAKDRITEIEGSVASRYFRHLFKALDYWGIREQDSTDPVNACLNYGYSILTTLVHRGLIIAGLDPCWGVGHKYRTRSFALVYDVVEPIRGWADMYLLAIYKRLGRVSLQEYKQGFVLFLAESEVVGALAKTRADWIDELCRSVASYYGNKFARTITTPR
jgi:CRISPR/Cas system-associated endonuclease Cas1